MHGETSHAEQYVDDNDKQHDEDAGEDIPPSLLFLDPFAFPAECGIAELSDVYPNRHGGKEYSTWLSRPST